MKVLSMEAVNQVSGGDLGVSLTANVPTADATVFAGVLGLLLTGQLDAAGFANAINANVANFNDMAIQSITVGNFLITPIPVPAPAPAGQ